MTDTQAILATIRTLESGGNYQASNPYSDASGAYQFISGTWGRFGGYAKASAAPPTVQDAKAAANVQAILDANGGDVSAVPVAWYIGHVPPAGSAEWDRIPAGGNTVTPRQYQSKWMKIYESQGGTVSPVADSASLPGVAEASSIGDMVGTLANAGKWIANSRNTVRILEGVIGVLAIVVSVAIVSEGVK